MLQKDFRNKFKIDNVNLEYALKKWREIRGFFPIRDNKDEPWFLMPNDMIYEMLLYEIEFRTQRGVLQELIFENFNFQLSDEGYRIIVDIIKGFNLKLDFTQMRNLTDFEHYFMRKFLEYDKGFSTTWKDLPMDEPSLKEMEEELNSELKKIKEDTDQALEIFRMLYKITARLKKSEASIQWGEKYLKFRSNDIDMLHNMQLSYFGYQMYQKFLSTAEKILELYESDLITHMNLLKYYIDINQNLKKAKVFIDKALSIIELNRNFFILKHFF